MAANPPVLHWQAAQQRIVRIQEEQFPLGLLPVSTFRAHAVEMHGDDLLVIATDGIIEVCSPSGTEFGIEALEGLLRSNAGAPLAILAESIFAAARAYGEQQDDQTLLLVRRTCRKYLPESADPDASRGRQVQYHSAEPEDDRSGDHAMEAAFPRLRLGFTSSAR
jgi:serine/threonine protein phosphatase PrpC